MNKPRILCVDDEPELLRSLRLNLRKQFDVTIAESGRAGIAAVEAAIAEGHDPAFDVIVSDMRMPEMSGAQFLSEMYSRHPEIPRLLLSGQSDLESTIAAINDAKILRFLTKPCSPQLLIETLDDCLETSRLRAAEKNLLELTLKGTVTVLSEILGLVSAAAYTRTLRIDERVRGACVALDRPMSWELGIATLLSQIGCVVVLDQEKDAVSGRSHVEIAAELLQNVPRLDRVADLVRHQLDEAPAQQVDAADATDQTAFELELLRCAAHFEAKLDTGLSRKDASTVLRDLATPPPRWILDAVASVVPGTEALVEVEVSIDQLAPGMQLTSDLYLPQGPKLATEGTPLTTTLIKRLAAFSDSAGPLGDITVLAPAAVARLAA